MGSLVAGLEAELKVAMAPAAQKPIKVLVLGAAAQRELAARRVASESLATSSRSRSWADAADEDDEDGCGEEPRPLSVGSAWSVPLQFSMQRKAFGDSFFELADTWTAGISPYEYSSFLKVLHQKVSQKQPLYCGEQLLDVLGVGGVTPADAVDFGG